MAGATSSSQQRQLTLTEELEKLEQSITLTLQEIDHNFSRAHRIVTSSILPVVEQYAAHSKDVWEGSKFWKQFFESSANVSLSGYEEQPIQQENIDETVTDDSNATTHTTIETSQDYDTPSAQHISTDSIQDLDLSNLTVSPSHSTPRPTAKQKQETASFADYPSPYEALKQEMNNTTIDVTTLTQSNPPETPGSRVTRVEDIAMTPQSSPFLPPQPLSLPRPSTTRKKTDPLLHRVLDKNYRIQATPLTTNRYTTLSKPNNAATPQTSQRSRNALLDLTLSSSPDVAPPQLHAEIFSSPQRKPRTPGVSVLTPAARRHKSAGQSIDHKATQQNLPSRTPGIWDSDDENEDDFDSDLPFDQSPPKTIQFHIPQSRLLRTPAKEASKRIVHDILQTAGLSAADAVTPDQNKYQYEYDLDLEPELDLTRDLHLDNDNDDDGQIEGNGRYAYDHGADGDMTSPSIVRRAMRIEDETF